MNSSSCSRKLTLAGFVLILASGAHFVGDPDEMSGGDRLAPVAQLDFQSAAGCCQSHHPASVPSHAVESSELAFPAELLVSLAPTDEEAAVHGENRSGWHRTLPVSEECSLEIVVNYYKERSGNLFVRAQLEGDDLSLLTMVVSGPYVKGHLVVPGEPGYEVTNTGETVHLRLLNDTTWSSGSS